MDEKDVTSLTSFHRDSNELMLHKLNNSDDVDSSHEFHIAPTEEENGVNASKDLLNIESSVSEHDSNELKTNNLGINEEMESRELEDEKTKNETLLPTIQPASTSANVNENRIPIIEEIVSREESACSNFVNEIPTTRDTETELHDDNESIFNQRNVNWVFKSTSNFEIPTDERKAIEILPENINHEQINVLLSKASNNEDENVIHNFEARIENKIVDETSNHVIQTLDLDESVNIDMKTLKAPDNLIRSKSVTEFNTARESKTNSLTEDAKLVKFSIPTKSVNIMQSNAQFLNKSRNFLSFITEKSTNIMEKTLLPQNLAAKYNSILRLTENNPTNYKKFIEDGAASSHSLADNPGNCSELHSEAINRIPFNVAKLNTLDIETTNSCNNEKEDTSWSNKGDSTKEGEKVFLKCSVNENKFRNSSRPIEQETRSTLSAAVGSEYHLSNSQFQTASMIDGNKINHSDSADNEVNRNSEASQRDSEASYTEITNGTDNTEKNSRNGNEYKIVEMSLNDSESRRLSVGNFTEEQKNNEEESVKILSNESIDLELLAHPAYVKLLRDYSNLKDQSVKLSEEMVKVEMENQRLEAENNRELHALQLEGLEKTIEQLKHDLKQAVANQELLNKEYILANRERESMVMKYAMSEKQLIDTQRAREHAERKVNEALKEQELLHTKLKQVHGERTRICNILDGKCHELTDAHKEVERLKEELNMREVKLKWTQNKLKTELETFKENHQKLDRAMIRINELKEECEQVRKESYETIRKFQQSEENKVVTLDHQLKEQQARLILERHVTEDKEMSRLQLQKEVETLKQRQHTLIEENNTLSLKVQNLEKERLNYENNLSNLKVIADQRQKEILDLVGKVSQLETLKLQLKHKEQLLSSNEAEIERLRQSNAELQSDMEWCREREAHMLDFTEKLTDKNVRLQSEFTSIEAKNEQLELEQGPLHEEIKELSAKVTSLEISLASEKSKRIEECELLARHVAEQTQLARNLSQKLEDSQGENAVLRRKQQISVKEMTKELQQCKKRLDAFEAGSPSNSLDRTSRTGSSSSLSTGETLNGAVSDNSNSGDNILQSVEPDRQTLIDRIVKLQRTRVRQAEKLDFLEEHTRTLVNELQKKTKIIKNYILHENPDAMGSNERDRNKAELARHGGIMASVYNQRVSDDNMTLELSLEMNQKLQAVLEDTLLKNITLKDSIDTLGGEIARLTMQNKHRQ